MGIFTKEEDEDDTMHGSKAFCIKYNVTQAGVCDKCKERYIDAPVIDGRAQCPNCDKP